MNDAECEEAKWYAMQAYRDLCDVIRPLRSSLVEAGSAKSRGTALGDSEDGFKEGWRNYWTLMREAQKLWYEAQG